MTSNDTILKRLDDILTAGYAIHIYNMRDDQETVGGIQHVTKPGKEWDMTIGKTPQAVITSLHKRVRAEQKRGTNQEEPA